MTETVTWAVERWSVDPTALDWRPLERFADVVPDRRVTADDFMWMGSFTLETGVRVQAYKHVDTRRYLHLDDAGHAYRFDADRPGFVPFRTPAAALDSLEARTDPAGFAVSRVSQRLASWHAVLPRPGRGLDGIA